MPNIVKGKISFSDGQAPQTALPVKAYHVSQANGTVTEKQLATGTCNAAGDYSLSYTPEVQYTHLMVRVFAMNGTTKVAESPVYYKTTAASKDVNLTIPAGTSLGVTEAAALRSLLQPLLGTMTLANYPEKALGVLCDSNGLPYDRVRMLSFADKYAATNAAAIGDMLYGIYRSGFPLTLREWMGRKASAWTRALDSAVTGNIVGTYNTTLLTNIANAVAKDFVAGPIDQEGKLLTTRLRAGMIAGATLTTTDIEKVVSFYLRFEGTDDDFWESSTVTKAVGASLLATAQFTVQVANMLSGYSPMITRLASQRKAGTIADLKALAAWDQAKWVSEITAANAATPTFPFPVVARGATVTEKIASLAISACSQLEGAFPTQKTIAMIEAPANASFFLRKADMLTFLKAPVNASFDLYKHNINAYIAANPTSTTGVTDVPKLKEEMGKLQRQFRLGAPGFEVRTVLLMRSLNLHSAFAVAYTGPEKLEAKSKSLGITGLGTTVYQNAMDSVNKVEAVRVQAQFSQVEPAVIQAADWRNKIDTNWKARIASMPELFGSLDTCDCEHCRSVYGPTAYLADIAQFLQRCKASESLSAWDILMKRRPDLKHILLNCTNATTEMPYIDLVIELLETECAKVGNLITGPEMLTWLQRQTIGKSPDLAIMPESRLPKVWDRLKLEFYPWKLPYSLWDDEGNALLKLMGRTRAELRDFTSTTSEFGALEQNAFGDILAQLGLLPMEAAAITRAQVTAYGSTTNPPTLEASWGTTPSANLSSLPTFIKQSGLDIAAIRVLLDSPYVNPGRAVDIVHTCDLPTATLSGIPTNGAFTPNSASALFLQRFQAFVRLQRALGWTANELDWALESFSYASTRMIDLEFLWRVSLVKRLQASTGLSVPEAIAMMGKMPAADLRGESALYTQLFIQGSAGYELLPRPLPTNAKIGDHLPGLSRAFACSPSETAELAALTKFMGITLDTNSLALLYRFLRCYRLLKLSPAKFSLLIGWIRNSPFDSADPKATPQYLLAALEQSRQLLDAGLNWDGLNFIFAAYVAPGTEADLPRTFKTLYTATKALHAELKAIAANPLLSPDAKIKAYKAYYDLSDPELIRLRFLREQLQLHYGLSEAAATEAASTFRVPRAATTFKLLKDVCFPEPSEDLAVAGRAAYILERLGLLAKAWAISDLEFPDWILTKGSTNYSYKFLPFGWASTTLSAVDLGTQIRMLAACLQLRPFLLNPTLDTVFDLMDSLDNSNRATAATGFASKTTMGKYIPPSFGNFSALFTPAMVSLLPELLAWMQANDTGLTSLEGYLGMCTDTTVADLRTKLRKQLDAATWQVEARKLRDRLRLRQVDATCDYLYGKAVTDTNTLQPLLVNYGSRSALFEYLLVDPEMGTCMNSSRIRLAHSTVQLFAQRCLMNLEAEVKVQPSDANEWKSWEWRKNYRVWEANRKVFLYPENYIEPELRDDKTPFFLEAESCLTSNNDDVATTELAIHKYVTSVMEVVETEVAAMGMDIFGSDSLQPTRDFDVISRPRSGTGKIHLIPFKNGIWGNWEELPFTVDSEYIISFRAYGKKYVFWPMIESKGDEDLFVEVKLCAGIYTNKKWKVYRFNNAKAIHSIVGFQDNIIDQKFHFQIATTSDSDIVGIKCFVYHISYQKKVLLGTFEVSLSTNAVYFRKSTSIETFDESVWNTSQHYRLRHQNIEYGNQDLEVAPGSVLLPDNPFVGQEWCYLVPNWSEGKPDITNYPFFFQLPNRTLMFQRTNPFNGKYLLSVFDQGIFKHINVLLNQLGVNGIYTQGSEGQLGILQNVFQQRLELDFYFNDYSSTVGNAIETAPFRLGFPTDRFIFEATHPHARYNWELFFHLPFLIASHLNRNMQFAEAQKWYHFIFDPTSTSSTAANGPERFWNFRPFRELYSAPGGGTPAPLATLEAILFADNDTARNNLDQQVSAWEDDAFNPHRIARIRQTAYMRTVVMHYIDNLLDWADMLFAQDTMESINEASQLYVLAGQILGPKPLRLPRQSAVPTNLDNLMIAGLDDFANAWVSIEENTAPRRTAATGQRRAWNNMIPEAAPKQGPLPTPTPVPDFIRTTRNNLPVLQMLSKQRYFCQPENEFLLGYWRRVEENLWKIRNCRNIAGDIRTLALFEPEIDPMLLVRSKHSGLSFEDVIADLYSNPFPHYRFQFLYQKAMEYASEVRNLGAAMLSALEKQDAEYMAMLQLTQEATMMQYSRDLRKYQIKEAQSSMEATAKALQAAESRLSYYKGLKKISPGEAAAIAAGNASHTLLQYISGVELTTSVLFMIPDVTAGVTGGVTFGGSNRGQAMRAYTDSLRMIASSFSHEASLASTLASYDRRWEEWKNQERSSQHEVEGLKKQLLAAEIRLAIAEREAENLEQQIAFTQERRDFQRDRFTNQALYEWMVKELKTIYMESYKAAFQLARAAERAFIRELDQPAVSGADWTIQFGKWDQLKAGLLAGEHLTHHLRRLEQKYMQANSRRLEITRHISVAQLYPAALLDLQEARECRFTVPAALFSNDFPDLQKRKIKSVTVTIPAVTGPFTHINAMLRLAGSTSASVNKIAISHAQNDAGMFNLNFADERYLPFEGAELDGQAGTTWELSLPSTTPAFDSRNISDVVLTINYTAVEGSPRAINGPIDTNSDGGSNLGLSMRVDFPEAWFEFQRTGSMTIPAQLEDYMSELAKNVVAQGYQRLQVFLIAKDSPASAAGIVGTYAVAAASGTSLGTWSTYNNNSQILRATVQGSFPKKETLKLTLNAPKGADWYDMVVLLLK